MGLFGFFGGLGFWGFFFGFFVFFGAFRVGRFGFFLGFFWVPKTRRFLSLECPAFFAAGDQVEGHNALVWIEGWVGACGHRAPKPSTIDTFWFGSCWCEGFGACVKCQSCLSFKVEIEQVRARCGTLSVWLRLGRVELRFDG